MQESGQSTTTLPDLTPYYRWMKSCTSSDTLSSRARAELYLPQTLHSHDYKDHVGVYELQSKIRKRGYRGDYMGEIRIGGVLWGLQTEFGLR